MYGYRDEKEKVERALAFLAAKNPGLGAHVSKYAIKKGMRSGGYAYFDFRDGSIVISKDWLKMVDHKGLAALLAHEALHGVLGHWIYVKERKVKHPLLWNLASDVEANSVLEELGLSEELWRVTWELARAEPVTWRKFSYFGVKATDPAELVYEKLLDKIERGEMEIVIEDQRGRKEEYGSSWETTTIISDVLDSVDNEKKKVKPKNELWSGNEEFRKQFKKGYEKYAKSGDKGALREAAVNALMELVGSLKVAGNLPLALERFVKPAKPKLPWNLLLRQSLKRGSLLSKRTWSVPNRRGLKYVPGYEERSSSVWLLVDTSASITDKELSQFLGEVVAASRFGKINLVAWDAQPYVITTSASKSVLLNKLRNVRGGGGTVIKPALELVYKRMKPGEPVVVLTDGYWFDEEDVTEVMRRIARKAGLALLATSEYVPVSAKEAGWKIIKISDERP